jgi:hypothetical protein
MLTVRELKQLTVQLDLPTLERQLGPFVLVQRPTAVRPQRFDARATVRLTDRSKPAPMKGVFDFEDLWVANLPPLSQTDTFLIGRAADCDVILDQDTVSKHHARIAWAGGLASVEDAGASNGVFVNTARISGKHALADNDLLTLGAVHMYFMHVATLRRRMGNHGGT